MQQSRSIAENGEDAFRVDLSYDLTDTGLGRGFFSSIDVGYRYNRTTSLRDNITSSLGLREIEDSPTGDLFADLLVAGPDNFDDADGRDLFVGANRRDPVPEIVLTEGDHEIWGVIAGVVRRYEIG